MTLGTYSESDWVCKIEPIGVAPEFIPNENADPAMYQESMKILNVILLHGSSKTKYQGTHMKGSYSKTLYFNYLCMY